MKVVRVTREYFTPTRTLFFYLPIQITVSQYGEYHGAVFEAEDMSTVWGFETAEAAWRAIDAYRSEHCVDEDY